MNNQELIVELAHTQGFCAGVDMAVETVELALEKYGTPLYVRHHIVHNTHVIERFEEKGVTFVESLDEIPDNAIVVFSAHGTAPEIYEQAKKKNLTCVDATCPLVTKVHREAIRYTKNNVQTILIGHRGHQELVGTSGYVRPDLLHIVESEEDVDALTIDSTEKVGYLTQTTLSVRDTAGIISKLKEKYPNILGGAKAQICYATQNRQNAVIELAADCDLIIICGSPASSNSNRLKDTAIAMNVESYIIDTVSELDINWLKEKHKIGISSGASVPRIIVDNLIEKIRSIYPDLKLIQHESSEKDIFFKTPKI